MASVDVIDKLTVRLNLTAPFSPLLAALADRAGMMVSPKRRLALGAQFGDQAGVLRAISLCRARAADRMVFERFPRYWNKASIHFDKVVYTPIVDATCAWRI